MSRLMTMVVVFGIFVIVPAQAQIQRNPPPGTVYLKDSIFIDKYPITNNAYREFLYAIQTFWSEKFHEKINELPAYGLKINESEGGAITITNREGELLIDSTDTRPDSQLYQRMKISERLIVDPATNLTMEYYTKAQFYGDYPIVYVTYEQAELFCEWRSDWVMLHYAVECKNKSERKKYPSKVIYRLANADEWSYAKEKKAQILVSDFGTRGDINKGSYANYKEAQAKSENGFNVYANNFAEILSDRKQMIGVLQNNDTNTNSQVVTKSYAPASNVGFRCICEVK